DRRAGLVGPRRAWAAEGADGDGGAVLAGYRWHAVPVGDRAAVRRRPGRPGLPVRSRATEGCRRRLGAGEALAALGGAAARARDGVAVSRPASPGTPVPFRR